MLAEAEVAGFSICSPAIAWAERDTWFDSEHFPADIP